MNLDALLEPVVREVKPCKLGVILLQLEEPYKSAVKTMANTPWDNGGPTSEELSDKLRTAGFEIGATTISRHRRRTCLCGGGLHEAE